MVNILRTLEFRETRDCCKFCQNNLIDSWGGSVYRTIIDFFRGIIFFFFENLEKNPEILGFIRICRAQPGKLQISPELGGTSS